MANDSGSLSEDDKRYLEYFWNGRAKKLRTSVPVDVIEFLEAEREPNKPPTEADIILRFTQKLRDYVTHSGGGMMGSSFVFKPTIKGVEYLKDRHPRLLILFERFVERVPWIALVFNIIGFIAAIIAIVEAVQKITKTT